MKVCKVTCDCCGKEIDSDSEVKVGMGKIGFEGRRYQFAHWWTFDLCKECFDKGKATFKSMWPYRPLVRSQEESGKD